MAPYSTRIEHDGATYDLVIRDFEAPRCEPCGEVQLTATADAQIRAALRKVVSLLSAEEIRRNRQELGLTQKALAEHLGAAEATISRWETGSLIQSKAMDNLLRVYFAFPQVRAALMGGSQELGIRID